MAMADKKFYIQRFVYDSERGAWKADGVAKSLEDDFGAVRYKSITGINSVGKQKAVYSESYPEADSLRVYVDPNAKRESITSTLTVYVFGSAPEGTSDKTTDELVLAAENAWNSLTDFLEGALVLWVDDYRQRKGLFLLQEAVEPTSDIVKNIPYLQCQIKLTNVFGRTFPKDSTTIEDWLKSGGKEAIG